MWGNKVLSVDEEEEEEEKEEEEEEEENIASSTSFSLTMRKTRPPNDSKNDNDLLHPSLTNHDTTSSLANSFLSV